MSVKAQEVPHRVRLLDAGTTSVFTYGSHGTTVDGVLAAAHVPKGSFYHHFGTKENFIAEVLDRWAETQTMLLRRWAGDAKLTVPERISGYYDELVEAFRTSNWLWSCMAGKLSNEMAVESEAARIQLARIFTEWKSEISALLGEGQQRGEVRTDRETDALADVMLALIEGAFVGALSLRESRDLGAVGKVLVDLVRTPAP